MSTAARGLITCRNILKSRSYEVYRMIKYRQVLRVFYYVPDTKFIFYFTDPREFWGCMNLSSLLLYGRGTPPCGHGMGHPPAAAGPSFPRPATLLLAVACS